MKKTQSLKLMLVGLLCSLGMSAWAQYTQKDGVVYGLNADGKAIVVGVLQNIPDGTWRGEKKITIADEVTIDGVTAKVVDFAADWKTPKDLVNNETGSIPEGTWTTTDNGDGSQTVTYKENGGTLSTVVFPATDPTQLGTLDFVLTATELTEITKDDIVGLPIAAFILGKNSGLVNIPDGLLADATSIEVHNDAKDAAIQAANDKLNGTTSWIIENGLYKGHKVYRMTRDSDGNPVSQERYFYVDESRNKPGGTNGNFLHPAFRFSTDGTFTPGAEPYYWVDELEADKKANATFAGTWKQVGTLVSEDTNLGKGHIPGSIENYNDAKLAQENAQKTYDDALTAYGDALSARGHKDEINAQLAANRKLADDLYNAIQVFDNEPYKSRAASVLKSNVQDPDLTAWQVAYTYATYEPSLVQDHTQAAAVNTFKDAYLAFFKKDPQAVTGVSITGIKGDLYLLRGSMTDAQNASGQIPVQAVDLTNKAGEILFQDAQNDLDAATPLSQGYYKLRALENNFQGLEYYIKKDPTTINPADNAYYALYARNVATNEFIPVYMPGTTAITGENLPLVWKVTGTEEYDIVPNVENAAQIDACDPYRAVIAVQNANKPKTDEDLNNDVTNTEKAKDEAKDALDEANDNLTAAEDQKKKDEKALADANKMPDIVNEYTYNPNGKNTTLLLGAFNNDVVSVGDYAFANCVNAEFTGTFKYNLVKIGAGAFRNTLFANLNLSKTGLTDWRGGDDGNADGVFDIKDRLNKDDIADDAFVGTPMETMRLASTDLDEDWLYNVVRNIQFEKATYTIDCEDEEYDENTTLTTVILPTGDDALTFDNIAAGTFENCVALEPITIPAQVIKIGNGAFKRCLALATINFAEVDSKLREIDHYAFYMTAASSIILNKQTKLSTIGNYTFAEMPNLETVDLSYTKVQQLKATVFENSKNLTSVIFFDATAAKPEETTAMINLPEKLFKTNKIQNLDLSKTKVETLTNLFYAGPGNKKAIDGCGNEYITNPINMTLESIILPENLKTIDCFALSSLQNANFKKVVIPSTVTWMGDGVFYNDATLEEVICEESQLTGFYAHTFGQCANLKKVVFLSVNGATPCRFGQPKDGEITWNTYWEVQGGVGRDGACLSNSSATVPGTNYGFGDNLFFSAGTNLKPGQLVEVVVTVSDAEVLTPAGGYSINPTTNRVEGSYSYLNSTNAGLELSLEADLNGEHYYWDVFSAPYGSWFDATQDVVIYSAYQMGNKVVIYPAKVKGPGTTGWYKVAAYNPNLVYSIPTYEGTGSTGTSSIKTIVGNDPASVCIIRSKNKTVYPQYYTDPIRKYQTTLDVENILTVARGDIDASTNLNYYSLAANGTKLKFIHRDQEGDVIYKGDIIIKTETEQGYGTRDFFDVVVVEPNDATAILGVKDYLNSNQNGAIYNLNGVRVSTPQKGQMYIQNGKKFIQK